MAEESKATTRFKHIGPNHSIDEYSTYINRNYQRAMAYYKAKENNFLNFIQQKLDKNNSNQIDFSFENFMQEEIKNAYYGTGALEGKSGRTILFEILAEGMKNPESAKKYIKDNEQNIPVAIKDVIKKWDEDTNGQFNDKTSIWKYWSLTKEGEAFEQKVILDIMKNFGAVLGISANDQITSDIQNIGKYVTKSYSKKKDSQSVIDYIIVEDGKGLQYTANKKGEITRLDSYNGLSTELNAFLDITKIEDYTKNRILNSYLKSSMYGFAVKAWTKGALTKDALKVFADSTVIQEEINKKLKTEDEQGHWHTWEPQFTSVYIMYHISKRIFNIMSPAQIGFLLPDGIYWFSDFLNENRLFMFAVGNNVVFWDRHKQGAENIVSKEEYEHFRMTAAAKGTSKASKLTNKKEAEFQVPDAKIWIQTLVSAHNKHTQNNKQDLKKAIEKAAYDKSYVTVFNKYDKENGRIKDGQIAVKPIAKY